MPFSDPSLTNPTPFFARVPVKTRAKSILQEKYIEIMFVFWINITDVIQFNFKIALWLRCYQHLREGGVGNPLIDAPVYYTFFFFFNTEFRRFLGPPFLKSILTFKHNWQRGILIKPLVQIIIYIYRKLMYWLAKM